MVTSIRNVEIALSGTGLKEPSKSEMKNKLIVRKSLFLNRNIKKGTLLTEKMLIALRPGDSISLMEIKILLEKNLIKT